jgi:hypothetical protein
MLQRSTVGSQLINCSHGDILSGTLSNCQHKIFKERKKEKRDYNA